MKKTVNHLADTIFWYLLYFMPVILFGIYYAAHYDAVSFSVFLSDIGFGIISDNLILNSLETIFGQSGILPFFSNPDVLLFFSYFVSVYLIHLFVDFILFIPRLCHKWLRSFTRTEDI